VRRILRLGGCLVDGVGLYSWPQREGKLTPPRKNPPIPLEACFLTPDGATAAGHGVAPSGQESRAAAARLV
jgi:hypothetical protein